MVSAGEEEEIRDEDQIEAITPPQKSGAKPLFSVPEENESVMGLNFYSVGATTFEVFMNVVRENNVREEGYISAHRKK
jgi:hypothetical protein